MPERNVTVAFGGKAGFEAAICDLTIDTTSVPGEARLAPSVLIHDEIGDGNWHATLSEQIRAKKDFVISALAASSARLLVFGAPQKISVNGHDVSEIVPQKDGDWHRADVPVEWLKLGLNEVICWGGGVIWLEPSKSPNRSAMSSDGGRTWDYRHLNAEHTLDGEYMVRLRLGQHPRVGSLSSPVIDLAEAIDPEAIAPRAQLESIQIESDTDVPTGTDVVFALRVGSTPTYTPQTWSSWLDPDDLTAGAAESWLESDAAGRARYLQWRASLMTDKPDTTPSIKAVTVRASLDAAEPSKSATITAIANETIVRGGFDFDYQAPGASLDGLRNQWPLEWIVDPGETELEKLILLRDWVKRQWKGWESGTDRPWNTFNILGAPVGERGMCVHFAVVFTQMALALGYNARSIIINHHFISEVWSRDLKKWIAMDAGPAGGVRGNRNMHYELDGEILSTLEAHAAWRDGKNDQLQYAATNPDDNGPMGDWADGFCRFFVPMRNNYLDVPRPAEDAHGCVQYHYDGYLHWEDDLTDMRSPEYSMQTARVNDLYWTLDQAELHLQQSDDSGVIDVQIATVTPNFKAFEIQVDDGEWTAHAAKHVWQLAHEGQREEFVKFFPTEAVERSGEYAWRLHAGTNTLAVRPVNAFGNAGITSQVTVEHSP